MTRMRLMVRDGDGIPAVVWMLMGTDTLGKRLPGVCGSGSVALRTLAFPSMRLTERDGAPTERHLVVTRAECWDPSTSGSE